MSVTPIDAARSPLSYARRYARIGWHVIPLWWAEEVVGEDGAKAWRCACGVEACRAPAKHPISRLVPQGLNQASTDTSRIEQWWAQYPKANIGVVLAASGLVAIDIDPRNGGDHSIEDVEARHGLLRSEVLAFTGGGGEHRVFSVPQGMTAQIPGKLGPGIDVKFNGYIVVEPSNHISGGSYCWEASSDPLEGVLPSPLPDWLRSVRSDQLPQEQASRTLTAAEVLELQSALFCIDPDSRDNWLSAGMAMHATGAVQQAYGIWAEWSRQSEKFDPVDQMRVWRSFKSRGLDGLSSAWIFSQAQRAGWVNPRSGAMRQAVIEVELQAQEPPDTVAEPLTETPARLMTIPGRLGDAVAWINATARKPQPLLAVQAAIALGSVVTGRRYRTVNGNWSMIYLLNVAQSGAGKEHAKHAVETLLEAAKLPNLIGAGRFASESGVLSSLIERPAQFSVLDEFGKMLQAASVAQNYADRNTLKALMEVWGRADGVLRPVAYSTAGMSSRQAEDLAKRLVRKPSLTLLAMTTPETIFGGLTSAAVADGFLNRFLTVHADRGRQMARTVETIEPPERLIAWIQHAHAGPAREGNLAPMAMSHDMEPTPIIVAFDAGALAEFRRFERAQHERMNELDDEGLSEMLTRATEMAMRLALIVAVSLEQGTIDRISAEWACAYVGHHGERNLQMLRERLSDGPFDQLCKEVLRLVRGAGARGMTERDLDKASRTWRGAAARMRIDALAYLQRREDLAQANVTTAGGRGRKRLAYLDAKLVNSADNADKTPTDASPN